MTSAGGIPIQGSALAITQLATNGTPLTGSTVYVQDDKPFMKFTAKPAMEAGVQIVPKSAAGVPIIAYRDFDRYKWWDVTLDLADLDFDKMVILGNGTALTVGSSSGRTFADGVVTTNSTTITSASTDFVSTDVGRAITGPDIPASTYIASIIGPSGATMTAAATGSTGPTGTYTLGAIAARNVGYAWPQLICTPDTPGVSIEIWMKIIERCSGFQGTTPYPSAGSVTPALPPSAWARFGAFRCYMYHADVDIEDKEFVNNFTGWAIQNPLFGTGPRGDWTTTGVSGGPPLDTTQVFDVMMDFQLPTPLAPGFRTIP